MLKKLGDLLEKLEAHAKAAFTEQEKWVAFLARESVNELYPDIGAHKQEILAKKMELRYHKSFLAIYHFYRYFVLKV